MQMAVACDTRCPQAQTLIDINTILTLVSSYTVDERVVPILLQAVNN
jgi:hypothetical protein